MKQLFCLFLAALLLALIFTGCASEKTTQPEVAVTAAGETTAASTPMDYPVPAQFTGEWTGLENTFTVHADAEILLPEDLGKLSTAKVTRHAFTQEEVDKVLEVFLKGNTLYKEIDLTKEQCQASIDKYEAILRGEIPYQGDGTIDRVPELIEFYKGAMEVSPHAGEKIPADTRFHPYEEPYGAVQSGKAPYAAEIRGYGEVDGRTLHFQFENSYGDKCDSIMVYEGAFGQNGIQISWESWDAIHETKSVPLAEYGQEKQLGDDLMEALGLTDHTCDMIIPVQYTVNGADGVMLEYVRKVNGLPLTKTDDTGSASEENVPYIGSWAYERIRVFVLEDRVVCFWWENPYEVTEVQPLNGEIMDFQEITEVFGNMFFVKNYHWLAINQKNGFDTFQDFTIDKVQLTLMRVRPIDSVSEGTIVPVWDFWGTEQSKWYDGTEERTGDPRYGVVCTLNAIDGTLIDREIGY